MEVSAKMKLASALVDSLGKGQVLAWSLEEKALVGPLLCSGATSPDPETGKTQGPSGKGVGGVLGG
jgi:hypothetical protein